MSTTELYVYYKLLPAQAPAVRLAFQRLCADLATQLPGLHSRLLARADADGERLTWMEVHAWPPGHPGQTDWEARLAQLAQTHMPALASPRHEERFIPLGDITD